jgi:hypothetical protein
MPEELTFEAVLGSVRQLKTELEGRLRVQVMRHPDWISSADARCAGLQDLWNVLRFAELSLVFVQWHLSDADWWERLRGESPSLKDIRLEFTAYTQGAKFGVYHLATSTFENALRAFLRALSPKAANGARAELKSVYDSLLKAHLRFPDDDLQLLDLVRLVRNTLHNTGVHRPPNRRSVTVLFRGDRYEFPDSGPIEFVTWPFVVDRIGDLVDLLDRVVNSHEVSSHTARIPADWATVYAPRAV